MLTTSCCPLPWSTIGDPWRSVFINHMRKNVRARRFQKISWRLQNLRALTHEYIMLTHAKKKEEEDRKNRCYSCFISVITDIQLNDFKTISKVPYKGNYKWVWNQLRLSADHKFCGVLDPRKVSKSLGGETHRRDPCQALPPCLLFYPIVCWWTSRFLPCPGYCKQCCDEHLPLILLCYLYFFSGMWKTEK